MKIASNGIQIHVEEQGDGDLSLIFLHYWGGSSRTWRKVMSALPKSHRSFAIDHRGWGDSDAPARGSAIPKPTPSGPTPIPTSGMRSEIPMSSLPPCPSGAATVCWPSH